jgi:hypothetical protein
MCFQQRKEVIRITEVIAMSELRSLFYHSGHHIPALFARAEPDDLYDPPPEAENSEPFLVNPNDYDLDDFDIYGLDECDEEDD